MTLKNLIIICERASLIYSDSVKVSGLVQERRNSIANALE